MKFVDRDGELRILNEAKSLSSKKLYTTAIYGLRRVGKTRLILEFLNENDLYLFVNKDKSSDSLLEEYSNYLKLKGIITDLEVIKNWDEFFKVIFERYEGVVVLDEFQNFKYVEPSVFGILQREIDLNENRKNLLLVFLGSTIGLIKKIFQDSKEPLYGRLKRSISLQELPFESVIDISNELKIRKMEDVLALYAVFGGFPKYYISIEDEGLVGKSSADVLEKLFFEKDAIYEDEVSTILYLEFGKRTGVYYDLLSAIANGASTISEVASALRKKETALTRQMKELIDYFNLVGVEQQVIGKKKRLYISHPLMKFWFKYFYKSLSLYKRRDQEFIKKVKADFNSHVGREFEKVCKDALIKMSEQGKIMRFEKIGRQWGKIPNLPKDLNQYEIDIMGINRKSKEILYAECKWKENVNPIAIYNELKEKSKHARLAKDQKEYFVIFAKSFKNTSKVQLTSLPANVRLIDLKQLKEIFMNQ